MSDDNSSPTVSDPEESQEQEKTNEHKPPLGAPPQPKAKGGGTCFLVCFALLLILVAALVVYFVTEGLTPGSGNHTTTPGESVSQMDTDHPLFEVTGSEGTVDSHANEETTVVPEKRAAFMDSDWPFESYIQLLGRPSARDDGECNYRMNLSRRLVRINSNLADMKKGPIRTKKHHMLQLKVTIPRSFFKDNKKVFIAVGLPQSAEKAAAVYMFDACNDNAIPAGYLLKIEPNNPNVRRKIIRGLSEKRQSLIRKRCYFENSLNDDGVVTLRTIIDLSYDSPDYTTPKVAVSSCNELTRRCRRQFKLQASLPLTGEVQTFVLYGVVPTTSAMGRLPRLDIGSVDNEDVPVNFAMRTRCVERLKAW